MPARFATAKTRSRIGRRTSLSILSKAGPSITKDSDLRRSHSTAVTLDRVSYCDAVRSTSLKKISARRFGFGQVFGDFLNWELGVVDRGKAGFARGCVTSDEGDAAGGSGWRVGS